ncbi:unnamed protein product [Dracunculus medinensis]|uniref:General transcription factor IIH subunit 4 n=1 Tax=Dracunculus medinensis TaxID=318479 RepID=A0A0N4ULW5_DRAME|nr:unnamed protein product [Dracunculus medinensis]
MGELSDPPILNYLSKRSTEQLHRLYASPGSTLCIFRLLPSLCQQFFLKAIWFSEISESSWVSEEYQSAVAAHLELLRALRIVELFSKSIIINPVFRHSYFTAICKGIALISDLKVYADVEQKSRKAANKDVGKKANERWECLLHYLALPSQKSEQGVSSITKDLLNAAGLTSNSDNGDVDITSNGFKFLLLNRTEQIWTYLVHYLEQEEAAGIDVIPQLDFLFRFWLSLCLDGIDFDDKTDKNRERHRSINCRPFLIDDSWPESLTNFIMHLRELGLIFIRKRKDGYFLITPLINYLTCASSLQAVPEKQANIGFIVVETNYRIYAYTDSTLQLAILSTFTEMIYRFNDISIGVLTRESARRAFQVGITASQIISFLRNNAHPVTLSAEASSNGTVQCVPVTIADQLRLWEDERQRLTYFSATIYSTFESENEYADVREFAKNEGILLWNDDLQRLLVVTEEGHDRVKTWWKAKKPANN